MTPRVAIPESPRSVFPLDASVDSAYHVRVADRHTVRGLK